MPNTSTVSDDFSGSTLGAVWAAESYGSVGVESGRAYVDAVPDVENANAWAGVLSDATYTLDDMWVEVVPLTPPTSVTAALAEAFFFQHPTTDGTRIGIVHSHQDGTISFVAEVAYDDAAPVSVTFDPVAHRFWRVSRSGSTLTWQTSPDGLLWKTRRTLVASSANGADWVTTLTGSILLEAYQYQTGTTRRAYFDNFNVAPVVNNPYVVEQTSGTSSTGTTNATSFTIPTTATTGLRLVYVACDGGATLSTTSTGWTVLGQGSQSTNVSGAVFVASSSSAAASLVVTSSTSQQISWIYERYLNVGSWAISSVNSASSTNSDPNPATATGGGGYFQAVAFRAGDAQIVPTAAPSGYTGLTNQVAGNSANGASVSVARRSFTASVNTTEDPGVFTVATDPWVAFTVLLSNPAPVVSATKFYLTSAAATYTPGVSQSFWSNNLAAGSPSLLGRAPTGSALTSSLAETSTTNPYYGLLRQFVSAPATGPGTISGLQQFVIGFAESDAAADMSPTVAVWITSGDSATVRDVVSSWVFNTEVATTPTGYSATAGTYQVDFQAGDRIVVEVGYRATNTTATSYTGTAAYGGTSGTDLAASDTDMTRPATITLPVTAGTFDTMPADVSATVTAGASVFAAQQAMASGAVTASVVAAAGFAANVSRSTSVAVTATATTGAVALPAATVSAVAAVGVDSPAAVEPPAVTGGGFPALDEYPGLDVFPQDSTPNGSIVTADATGTAHVYGVATPVTVADSVAAAVRDDTARATAATTAAVDAVVEQTGPGGVPLTFGQIVVGRFILTETLTPSQEKGDITGRTLSITGQESSPPMTFEQLAAQHDDILGLPGATVPIQFTDKSDRTGYYYVVDASVDEQSWGRDHDVVTANWTLNLQRVGTDTEVDIESRLAGPLTRSNPFGLTGERWHAPPYGHSGYWSGAVTPSTMVRESVDGPITVYRGLPVGTAPRWACPVEMFMRSRARFIINARERTGITADLPPTGWEVSNGVVRVTPASNGLSIDAWDASEWQPKRWLFFRDGVNLGAPVGLTIVRNEPECVIVRLLWTLTPGRVTADLTIRRGSRFVEVHVNSSAAATLKIQRGHSEPATAPTSAGYVCATDNDDTGNRYVIGSSKFFTPDTVRGGISVTSAVELDAFIGVELDGTAAQPGDTAPDLVAQYLGVGAEVTRTVRR